MESGRYVEIDIAEDRHVRFDERGRGNAATVGTEALALRESRQTAATPLTCGRVRLPSTLPLSRN